MNHFVARVSPDHGDEGRVSNPSRSPANLSPYEFFIAEKERLNRLLTNAGIDEDWAAEVAIHVAMQKTTGKLNPDDYEFCNQVYDGDSK